MNSSAPPPDSTAVAKPPLRRWVLVPGALLLGYMVWQFPTWQRQAAVGAAYAARIGCSCRFIEGRDIANCTADFEPGMAMVSLDEIDGEQAVRASVPLIASRTARFEAGTGCVLQSDD